MHLKQKKLNLNKTDDDIKLLLLYEINNHILLDKQPSTFLNSIVNTKIFKEYPFYMLYKLKETEQSPIHHPEGNAWNHTMLVVDEAAKHKNKSRDERAFMWAALLHDIGKAETTKNKKGKITAYNHESVGADLCVKFLQEFTTDDKFIQKVKGLVRWHMQILHVVKDMPFADIKSMKEETDIKEVALLGFCDRMGRTNVDILKEKNNIKIFLDKCLFDI
ncbi:MAG: HDIG domain-containing protein [Tissierellia bacterium]|jgi:putative nucleotidyltransferase with HDIG domain|nr:HDIG domain-containing protein [Tissierellia bacterium]MDD3226997.1 HDIG domain-containing protein [Tissierellia bacterium]MDD4045653.1 HDIG domain-containing protein [Tissierellia bacterium]